MGRQDIDVCFNELLKVESPNTSLKQHANNAMNDVMSFALFIILTRVCCFFLISFSRVHLHG